MDVFLRRKDFFYHEDVLLVVAKVVVVRELGAFGWDQIASLCFRSSRILRGSSWFL